MSLITLNLLDRDTVVRLHETIKPVIRVGDTLYTIAENYDVCDQSFLWYAQPADPVVDSLRCSGIRHTLHNCGYPGLFKPSVQEVVSSIGELTSRCNDFYELVAIPSTPDDLQTWQTFTNSFVHVAQVQLYCRHKPD